VRERDVARKREKRSAQGGTGGEKFLPREERQTGEVNPSDIEGGGGKIYAMRKTYSEKENNEHRGRNEFRYVLLGLNKRGIVGDGFYA